MSSVVRKHVPSPTQPTQQVALLPMLSDLQKTASGPQAHPSRHRHSLECDLLVSCQILAARASVSTLTALLRMRVQSQCFSLARAETLSKVSRRLSCSFTSTSLPTSFFPPLSSSSFHVPASVSLHMLSMVIFPTQVPPGGPGGLSFSNTRIERWTASAISPSLSCRLSLES